MTATLILPNHAVSFTIAASDKLATWSIGDYTVDKIVGYPNIPDSVVSVFAGSGANTTAAFSAATEITIAAGNYPLYYATGTGPVIPERANLETYQGAPGALNATGTLTAALVLGGIVTSSTAAAVTATLDTGTVMDQVLDAAADAGFFWSAINTGGSNAFTVTAATGHTIVGAGAVAASSSGRFLTRRTAANTWITYRLS
jgi:hypothetical protein